MNHIIYSQVCLFTYITCSRRQKVKNLHELTIDWFFFLSLETVLLLFMNTYYNLHSNRNLIKDIVVWLQFF